MIQNSIRISDENVWKWHQICEAYLSSGWNKGKASYCKNNGINYSNLNNMLYRMYYKKFIDPKTHNKLVEQALTKPSNSNISISEFCKEKGFPTRQISETVTYIHYNEIINRLRKAKGVPELSLYADLDGEYKPVAIPVESAMFKEITPVITPVDAAEITKQYIPQIKASNDIEISLNRGVKVIISSEIDNTKIFKIIDFLKEL